MNIIQKQPNPSGAYPPIQSWSGETIPNKIFDTHYQVADGVELSCGGFGTLTVEDGIVTAFTPDIAEWEAWQAEHPTPIPEPSNEKKITDLTSKLNATIQSNSMLEECIVEMAGVVYV